jgi:hypothetical protein
MRRFIAILGALTLLLAVQAGCKKDDAPAAKTGEADKAAEAAKKAGDEAAKAGAEAAKAGAEAGEAAKKAGDEAVKAAEKVAEANPQPTPADSPAAVVPDKLPAPAAAGDLPADFPIGEAKLDQLVKFSEEMATILEENATDAAAAAKKLEEYLGTNKEAREALLKEFEGMKEKLTPEQQTALGMKLLSKLGPLMQRMQKLFQEHPELASDPRIQAAMTPFKK